MATEDFLLRFRVDLSEARSDLRQFAQEQQRVAATPSAAGAARPALPPNAQQLATQAGVAWAAQERQLRLAQPQISKAELDRERRRVMGEFGGSRFQDVTQDKEVQDELMRIRRAAADAARRQLAAVERQAEIQETAARLMGQDLAQLRAGDQRAMQGPLRPDYTDLTDVRAGMREKAGIDRTAAADPGFLTDHLDMRQAQTQLSTMLSRWEAASDEFVQWMSRMRTAQAEFVEQLNRANAASNDYVNQIVRTRTSAADLNTTLNRATRGDNVAVASIANERTSERQLDADVLARQAQTPVLAEAEARAAQALLQIAAQRELLLTTERTYIDNSVSLARSTALMAAQRDRILSVDAQYIMAQTDRRIASQQRGLGVRSALVESGDFERLSTAATGVKASEQRVLAANQGYIDGVTGLTIVTNQRKAVEARAQNSTEEVIQSQAGLKAAQDENKAKLAQAAYETPGVAEDRAVRADYDHAMRGVVSSLRDAEAAGQNQAQMQRAAAAAEASRLRNLTEADALLEAQNNIGRKQFTEQVRLQEIQSDQMEQLTRVRAQRIAAEIRSNQVFQRQIVEEMRASGASWLQIQRARTGAFGGGRMEGGGASATGMAGFFGGGLMGMARYAIPSALAFGGIQMIRDTITEAEELERIMTQIQSQLEATGKGDQVEGLRNSIMQIARDTGTAAQEVAEFAFQLEGAFGQGAVLAVGPGPGADTQTGEQLVRSQLEAVTQLAKLTDISSQEALNSITATSLAFGVTGDYIGDVAFTVADRVGVVADEVVNFLGKISPAAQDAGFSLAEMAAIAGLAQQRSGVSGTALAEQFGRIIPAISGARNELRIMALANEQLGTPEFFEALAQNDIPGILEGIARSYNRMTGSDQNRIAELLGGRREAQTLLSILNDPIAFDGLVRNLESVDVEGKMSERFEAYQETLGQNLDRLAEQFRQLGIAVFESGIDEAFLLGIRALSEFMQALEGLFNLWNGFNDALGGTPQLLLMIAGAVRVLTAAYGALTRSATQAATAQAANGATGLRGRLGGAAARVGASSLLGPGLIASAGILAVSHAYQGQDAEVAEAAQAARDRMKEMTIEELERIKEQHNSFFDTLSVKFFGEDLPSEIAAQLIVDKKVEETSAELQPLFDSEVVEEYVSGLVAAVLDPANQHLLDGLNRLRDNLTEEGRRQMAEAMGPDFLEGPGMRPVEEPTAPIDPNVDLYGHLRQQAIQGGQVQVAQEMEFDPGRVNLDELNEERLQNAREAAAAGQQWAIDLMAWLHDVNRDTPELLSEPIRKGLEDSNVTAAEAKTAADAAAQRYDVVKAQFEAGRASRQQLLDSLDEVVRSQREGLYAATEPDDLLESALLETEAEQAKTYAEGVTRANQLAAELDSITKNDIGANRSQYDRLLESLRDPQLTDPDTRRQIVRDLISLQDAFIDAKLDTFESAQEAIDWLNGEGRIIPPELRVEIIENQLRENTRFFESLVSAYTRYAGEAASAFIRNMLALAATGEAGAAEARSQWEARLAGAQRAIMSPSITPARAKELAAIIQGAQEEIARLDQLAQGAPDPYDPGPTRNVDAQMAEQQERRRGEIEDAQREAERQAEEARRAAQELADARADYALALIEGDPVRAAQHAIREANRAYREAENEAGRVRAAADRIRAERQLQDALRDIQDAQLELVMAQVEYAGDTVRTAELGLQAARVAVERARADFASGAGGEADVIRAEAELRTAQGRLRDEQLSSRMEDYEYLYEMEQITKGQLIQYLQSLKQIPDLTQDQIRDIDRRIRQLNQELGQDLQFNLPTNLQLPTLYEARRLNQTPGGGGYQDNRNVTITLYVTDGMTADQAAQMVNEAVGGGGRVGTMVRRY